MKDCECYKFKLINQTYHPTLKNVDLAIVLTMENSSRKFEDPILLNLAPLTYVQINKGFKNCNKPDVNSVTEDIIHSYKNVFRNTLNYNNIIVFEDDAVYNTNYNVDEFKNIDTFIKNNSFSVYSFGNVSIDLPTLDSHKQILFGYGACHANIYSKNTRLRLLYSNGYIFDVDILSNLPNKYKHKYPLICQTFPNTDSKKEWEQLPGLSVLHNLTVFLNGHRTIEPFWSTMYVINDVIFVILILFILFIIKCYI